MQSTSVSYRLIDSKLSIIADTQKDCLPQVPVSIYVMNNAVVDPSMTVEPALLNARNTVSITMRTICIAALVNKISHSVR